MHCIEDYKFAALPTSQFPMQGVCGNALLRERVNDEENQIEDAVTVLPKG